MVKKIFFNLGIAVGMMVVAALVANFVMTPLILSKMADDGEERRTINRSMSLKISLLTSKAPNASII